MKTNRVLHWVYCLLMLIPMFFIGFKSLYVVFNDNAYMSYSGSREDTYEVVNDYLDLQSDREYHFSSKIVVAADYTYNATSDFYVSNIHNVIGTNTDLSSVNRLRPYKSGSIVYVAMYSGDTSILYFRAEQSTISFDFVFDNCVNYTSSSTVNLFNGWIYNIVNSDLNYADNAFDYAINDLTNRSFYSWTLNSSFYNIFDTFGNTVGVNNVFVKSYLTYGLSISLIYLGYEVLMAFIQIVRKLVYAFLDKEF